MAAALDWTSGISWTLVYAIAVYIGLRKKTYCIPGVCICLNFTWELFVVLARIQEHSPLNSGFVSQLLWLVLDVGVLYTWLRYGNGTKKKKLAMLFLCALVMAAVTLGANLWAYAAFVINLIMSVIFLFSLDKSMCPCLSIALLKCLGTSPATVLNGLIQRDLFILCVGGLCMIADLYYIFDLRSIQKIKQ